MHFDAFISYRRSDGSATARWLRKVLQSYRFPKSLRAHYPDKAKVFLDTVYERGASDFYEKNIHPNLMASRHLIVVATPDAVARADGEDWISREVADFHAGSNPENIIVVRAAGAFDGALPADIGDRYPNVQIVDLRSVSKLNFLNPRRANELAVEKQKIVAALFNVSNDHMPLLRQEEERQRQMRLGIGVGATSTATVFAATLSTYALYSQIQGKRALDESLLNVERVIRNAASDAWQRKDDGAITNKSLSTVCQVTRRLGDQADLNVRPSTLIYCDFDYLVESNERNGGNWKTVENDPNATAKKLLRNEWANIRKNIDALAESASKEDFEEQEFRHRMAYMAAQFAGEANAEPADQTYAHKTKIAELALSDITDGIEVNAQDASLGTDEREIDERYPRIGSSWEWVRILQWDHFAEAVARLQKGSDVDASIIAARKLRDTYANVLGHPWLPITRRWDELNLNLGIDEISVLSDLSQKKFDKAKSQSFHAVAEIENHGEEFSVVNPSWKALLDFWRLKFEHHTANAEIQDDGYTLSQFDVLLPLSKRLIPMTLELPEEEAKEASELSEEIIKEQHLALDKRRGTALTMIENGKSTEAIKTLLENYKRREALYSISSRDDGWSNGFMAMTASAIANAHVQSDENELAQNWRLRARKRFIKSAKKIETLNNTDAKTIDDERKENRSAHFKHLDSSRNQAKRRFDSGEYIEAISSYRRVLAMDRDWDLAAGPRTSFDRIYVAEVTIDLARVMTNIGQSQQAKSLLKKTYADLLPVLKRPKKLHKSSRSRLNNVDRWFKKWAENFNVNLEEIKK